MSAPADSELALNINELLNAQAALAAQQITGLIRRCAELEAQNGALRRLLAGTGNGHVEQVTEDG